MTPTDMSTRLPPNEEITTVLTPPVESDKNTRNSSVHNPHDAFFRTIMTDLSMARRFFEVYLPERFKSCCYFSTLTLQPGSFVESNLRQHFSDLLYALQIGGQEGYIYALVEHITQAKPTTAFQVLRYQIAAMHQAMKQGREKPPIVIPILFYRGKKSPYPESCDPFDCFEDPALARETLLMPHILVDISVIPDEELKTHKEIAMMELLEKHITYRDLIELIGYLTDPLLRAYLSTDQFKSVVHYLEAAGHSDNYQEFFRLFHQTSQYAPDRTIMQTLGDYLRQQGMQQGMQQGIQQGMQQGMQLGMAETNRENARKMIQKGSDYQFIAFVTGLSEDEIKAL